RDHHSYFRAQAPRLSLALCREPTDRLDVDIGNLTSTTVPLPTVLLIRNEASFPAYHCKRSSILLKPKPRRRPRARSISLAPIPESLTVMFRISPIGPSSSARLSRWA